MKEPRVDLAAEQAILGACLLSPEVVGEAVKLLGRQMFYRKEHGDIWHVIWTMYDNREPIDLLTVSSKANNLGFVNISSTDVASMPNALPSLENWRYYANLVVQCYLSRELFRVGSEIMELSEVPDPSAAYTLAHDKLAQALASAPTHEAVRHFRQVAPETLSEIELAIDLHRQGKMRGVPFGFKILDEATSGQWPGNVIAIMARTSRGKSVLAGQLWMTASQTGPSLICSNEMTSSDYVMRQVSRFAEIPLKDLRSGVVVKEDPEFDRIVSQMGQIGDLPLYMRQNVFTVDDFIDSLDSVKKQAGSIVWACLDWLQLTRMGKKKYRSDVQELDDMMRVIKETAMECKIPIVIISQLDKKSAMGGDPEVESMRGSAMIAHMSDIVIQVQEDKRKKSYSSDGWPADLRIMKARNSPLAVQPTWFMASNAFFQEREEIKDGRYGSLPC